jgi:hypothetical protein
MPSTFLLEYLVLSVVIFALLFVFWSKRRERILHQQQIIGIELLKKLRLIMADMQRHRGLTSAYLNGSQQVRADIAQLKVNVDRNMTQLVKDCSWFSSNERWKNIDQHWHRLSQGFHNHTVDNNLQQHNLLIKNVIFLIDDMAQSHFLVDVITKQNFPLYILWREILPACEYIGQARALSAATLSLGYCDSVVKIRLRFLIQKIESSSSNVWHRVSVNQHQKNKIKKLLACIDDDVIAMSGNMAVLAFFQIATDALDSMYEQYDASLSQ